MINADLILVLSTTSIYGPYDRFDDQKSHVIPALIKRALNKEDPFVVWEMDRLSEISFMLMT